MSKPVVLVGLPGAGKSTIAAALAARLNRNFLDSDAEIEGLTGVSVAEYFKLYGESAFRSVERDVVASLIRRDNCVIALGGGAFDDLETRRLVKLSCTSVWLNPSIEIVATRLGGGSSRPLLNGRHPLSGVKSLLDKRREFYAEADFRIEDKTLKGTLEQITRALPCAK